MHKLKIRFCTSKTVSFCSSQTSVYEVHMKIFYKLAYGYNDFNL